MGAAIDIVHRINEVNEGLHVASTLYKLSTVFFKDAHAHLKSKKRKVVTHSPKVNYIHRCFRVC